MSQDLGDCPCEDYEVGDSCFGKLRDDEMLARIIRWEFISKNGGILERALRVNQFLEGGWSFVRHDCVNMECAIKKYMQDDNKHTEVCYANIKTSDMRALRDEEGRRQVCVIANPLEGNPEHALAHNKYRNLKRSEVKMFRDELLKKFDKVSNGE